MAQQYTIKKGDTLGDIAYKFGTKISNLSGFKSGSADLIFPGEKITINTPEVSAPAARSNEVRSSLAPEENTAYTPTDDRVESNRFQTELTDNKKKQEDAFKKLEGFRTKRYDSLRKERGLEKYRGEITSLDKQIADRKSERDASLAKVKKNPGASAATITGEVRGVTDQLNADINNLISQRNTAAGSYNTELGEIDRIVAQEAGDLESELGFYNTAVTNSSSALSKYNEAIVDELRRTEDRNYAVADDLRDFEQALQVARIKGSGSNSGTTYQLKFDPITGESFLFNPKTGDVESPDDVEVDESTLEVNQSILPDTAAGKQKSGGGFFQGIKDFFTGG